MALAAPHPVPLVCLTALVLLVAASGAARGDLPPGQTCGILNEFGTPILPLDESARGGTDETLTKKC